MPRLLNFIVAIYLIAIGLLGLGILEVSRVRPGAAAARLSSRLNRNAETGQRPAGFRAFARTSVMAKWVYGFGGGKAEGKADMKNLLGGKGANLAEMANLGLPVPPGFTITTEVCTYFYANGESYPKELAAEVDAALAEIGTATGKGFGDGDKPAAGVGALGRARVDAGHDGHRAQSRPQRRDRRGAGEEIRRPRASPTIPIAASSPCIRTWCSASSIICSRTFWPSTRTPTATGSIPS